DAWLGLSRPPQEDTTPPSTPEDAWLGLSHPPQEDTTPPSTPEDAWLGFSCPPQENATPPSTPGDAWLGLSRPPQEDTTPPSTPEDAWLGLSRPPQEDTTPPSTRGDVQPGHSHPPLTPTSKPPGLHVRHCTFHGMQLALGSPTHSSFFLTLHWWLKTQHTARKDQGITSCPTPHSPSTSHKGIKKHQKLEHLLGPRTQLLRVSTRHWPLSLYPTHHVTGTCRDPACSC
ncbi:hypothetical protein P7K49_026090, partial [Saguinus oedipus]